MVLVRSLAAGFFGACFYLVVQLATGQMAPPRQGSAPASPPAPTQINVVDVAYGIHVREVARLLRLAPGEHIVEVDGRTVASDLEAGVALASSSNGRGRYIDLTVDSPTGERRMLVLMH